MAHIRNSALVLGCALCGAPALTAESGYDPLALDHFLEASHTPPWTGESTVNVPGQTVAFALDRLRFDAEGYLVGPDGVRIYPLVRIRWQIGANRRTNR